MFFMKDSQRAEQWLRRAAELRTEALAAGPDARASLLKLAADWEHMGLKAQERAQREVKETSSRASAAWTEIPGNSRGPDTPRRH